MNLMQPFQSFPVFNSDLKLTVTTQVIFIMKTKMKNILIIICLMLFCMIKIHAQEEEIQTLFGDRPLEITGFGGPFMNFSVFNKEFAYMMGGGGGIIINNFMIGGYGIGLANTLYFDNSDEEISFGHGGFWLGYQLIPDKLVHPVIQVQLGWGGLNSKDRYGELINNLDKLFIITPILEVEMNITRFFRIGLGGSYRIAAFTDNSILSAGDMSGPGVNLAFKFGWF